MKRLLLLGASLVLGIIAASQLPAAPPTHPNFGGQGKNHNGSQRHSPQLNKSQFSKPQFQQLQNQGMPKFGQGSGIQHKPFQPLGPKHPIVNKPNIHNPIKVQPGFPIKPNHGSHPVVKPFPIKPTNPIAKPWPIKPIHKPHHDHDDHHHDNHHDHHNKHHKHCAPHWCKPLYPWMWHGGCGVGNYVVSTPIYVTAPVVTGQFEQLPEVQVGATITLPAQNLGQETGVAMLRLGDITLGVMVNQWSSDAVQLTLPMVGLEQPKRAEIIVMFANGQVAMNVPVKLLPGVPPVQ